MKAGWFRPDAVYYSGDDSGVATFGTDLVATGGASRGAAVHFDLLGLPVDLGVMFAEPRKAEDKVLLA